VVWRDTSGLVYSAVVLSGLLTGGYACVTWLIGRVAPKKQGWIHIGLLAVSVTLVALLAYPFLIEPNLTLQAMSFGGWRSYFCQSIGDGANKRKLYNRKIYS